MRTYVPLAVSSDYELKKPKKIKNTNKNIKTLKALLKSENTKLEDLVVAVIK